MSYPLPAGLPDCRGCDTPVDVTRKHTRSFGHVYHDDCHAAAVEPFGSDTRLVPVSGPVASPAVLVDLEFKTHPSTERLAAARDFMADVQSTVAGRLQSAEEFALRELRGTYAYGGVLATGTRQTPSWAATESGRHTIIDVDIPVTRNDTEPEIPSITTLLLRSAPAHLEPTPIFDEVCADLADARNEMLYTLAHPVRARIRRWWSRRLLGLKWAVLDALGVMNGF